MAKLNCFWPAPLISSSAQKLAPASQGHLYSQSMSQTQGDKSHDPVGPPCDMTMTFVRTCWCSLSCNYSLLETAKRDCWRRSPPPTTPISFQPDNFHASRTSFVLNSEQELANFSCQGPEGECFLAFQSPSAIVLPKQPGQYINTWCEICYLQIKLYLQKQSGLSWHGYMLQTGHLL